MTCEDLIAAYFDGLRGRFHCSTSENGRLSVVTPYLYPDHDNIELFVREFRDGVEVSDLGETLRRLDAGGPDGVGSSAFSDRVYRMAESLGVSIQQGVLVKRGERRDAGLLLFDVLATCQAISCLGTDLRDSIEIRATRTQSGEHASEGAYTFNNNNSNADVLVELDRLSRLPKNWDSYGAPAIDPRIIAAAKKFVEALPENLAYRPRVVPMSTGNLQFEWHHQGKILELEFESPKTIHFLQWHPQAGVEEEDTFPAPDVDRAVGLIQWLMSGTTV